MSTFNPPADIAQITLAKSSDVNAVKAATGIAFGLLPNETKLQRGTVNFSVDTGTANSYVVTLDASITTYTDGLQVVFRPLNSNTDISTINLNGIGVRSIRLTDSNPIQAGDISAGAIIDVRYSTATGFFHLTPNSAIYAHDAGVSATAAASSAVASALSASDSLSYRNTAEGYKNTAVSSAAAAGSSATASALSASDSLSYRNTAEGYKNAAGDSAAAASSSAVASAGSASDALSYRNTAEGYKNTAGDSAAAASSSATSAAAAYDSFDDRYLGAKTSDPTLDNDGNALLTGALYWNTTASEMRVYSGSAWITAYLPASGYLALSGGTMTGAINFASSQTVDGTNAIGYINIPQNIQSAAYTLVAADAGKHIFHPSSDTTARTFTIPANSSVAYPIGTELTVINQYGAGDVTLTSVDTLRIISTGTTGKALLATGGMAKLIKVNSTEWLVSGAIKAPPVIGEALGGGFYAGQINVSGTKYNLIVAPKSTGDVGSKTWGINNVTTGITSDINGPTNSASLAALGASYQAATFCEGLTIGGYTDWYLPARNELEVLYYYLKPSTSSNAVGAGSNANAVAPEPISTGYTSGSPAQTTATGVDGFRTGETNAFASYYYWSSTEGNTANRAYSLHFDNGGQYTYDQKTEVFYVRAVRRVLA